MRCSSPVREFVAWVPAPRSDHRKNEGPTVTQQCLIDVRIAVADLLGHMSEVEFNRPTATRLEVYEQRPIPRAEHIAWVRLAVEQLLKEPILNDRVSGDL